MRFSILLVNWNGKDDSLRCLESLEAQSFRDFETILVDNASRDGSVAALGERFGWVRLIALDENTGFATANNIAARHATGELLFVLNTDTVCPPDLLATLDEAARHFTAYDIFSCRMLRMSDPSRIDCKGLVYRPTLRARMIGVGDPADPGEKPQEITGATGGAMLLRRHVYERIGLFDDAFFFNNEDVDFALRAFGQGLRTLYLPQAVVYHRRSPIESRLPDLVLYYIQRNLELAAIKNVPLTGWLALMPLHAGYTLFQLAKWGLKGKAGLVLKAKRDALRLAPKLERRPMSTRAFWRLLRSARPRPPRP